MSTKIIPTIIYHELQKCYFGIVRYSTGCVIELCSSDREHIHGYNLLKIDRDGYYGYTMIGEENHGADENMSLSPRLELIIIGIDDI